MKKDKPVSNCCQAPIIIGGLPKKPIKGRAYTMWNECTKCGEACDYFDEGFEEFTIILEDFYKVSTNKIYASRHWSFRKNAKDSYKSWFNKYKNNFPKFDYKVNLDFKFYWYKKPLDSTNCSFIIKMIEDCMTKNGIIKDDTIEYVGKVSMESFETKEKDDYCELRIKRYE